MNPNKITNDSDRSNCKDHSKMRWSRRLTNLFKGSRNDTECRENNYVDFWMTEESKQMLKCNRVSSRSESNSRKSAIAEVSLEEKNSNSSSENWQSCKKKQRNNENSSNNQISLKRKDSWRTRKLKSCKKSYRTCFWTSSEKMKRKNCQWDGTSRRKVNSSQRKVKSPSSRNSTFESNRNDQHLNRQNGEPESQIVQTRSGKVEKSHSSRQFQVSNSRDKSRHDEKKNHTKPMRSDRTIKIILKAITEEKNTWNSKFNTDQNWKQRIERGKIHETCGSSDCSRVYESRG